MHLQSSILQTVGGKLQGQEDLESGCVRTFDLFIPLTQCTNLTLRRARHLRLPAPSKKTLPSIQVSNPYTRRSDFIRPPSSKGRNDDNDDDSDNGSVASVTPFGRAQSATSSTYISGRSLAPSVTSASRYSSRARQTSPTRLQVPTSISMARSRSVESRGGSPPPERKGPSSVVSADIPRRPWGFQRTTRPFFQPK